MGSRRGIDPGWILFGIALALYWGWPSAQIYWDGVEYAQIAERAQNWREALHPHHLFYNLVILWLTRLLFEPLKVVHPGLVSQVFFNGLMGAFAVMFAYRTLKYFFKDPLAWQCAGIYLAAYTWWIYASGHAPYVAAVFRMNLIFYTMAICVRDEVWKPGKLMMAGVNAFLATMFHQAAGLFLIPWVYFLFARPTRDAQDAKQVYQAVPLVLSVGLVAFHYWLFAFVSLDIPDFNGFLHWALGYGEDKRWWYLANHPWWMLPWAIVKSHVATLVYPHYVFSLTGFLGNPLTAESGVVLDLIKKGLVLVILKHLIPAVLGGFQHAKLFLELQPKVIRVVLLWWVGLFFVFFGFFQPQQAFYRLFYLLPIVLLIGVGVDRGFQVAGKSIKADAWTLFVALLIFNFGAGVLPGSKEKNNPWLMQARRLVKELPKEDLVIVLPNDAEFSVDDSIHATRTWELVEYLAGPGMRQPNRVEVLYGGEAKPNMDPQADWEYLPPPSAVGRRRRLLWWDPVPGEGALGADRIVLSDRSFAHRNVDTNAMAWGGTISSDWWRFHEGGVTGVVLAGLPFVQLDLIAPEL